MFRLVCFIRPNLIKDADESVILRMKWIDISLMVHCFGHERVVSGRQIGNAKIYKQKGIKFVIFKIYIR
ncbi:hypothetical protein LWI28_008740 [Acer negundo]|uniref:Uncharacterized protein n=1 Tax=Acer negundo TaxID=4023 RepID=A0AAD5IDU2_ACENE|nr:hypothetical protein LWI28_008740 [Acer negundo]